MDDRDRKVHPDLEDIADWVAAELDPAHPAHPEHPDHPDHPDLGDAVAAHLNTCALCRIEAARLRRFLGIEADEDLAREADLDRAEAMLQDRFAAGILPAARPAADFRGERNRNRRRDWPAFAALAAALVLIVLSVGPLERLSGSHRPPLLRGGGSENPAITDLRPAGRLDAAPDSFTWSAADSFTSFVVEIFTPDLDVVYRGAEIPGTTLAVSDSLAGNLLAGRTYLWTVKARAGLSEAAAAEAWFTIGSE